MIFSVLYGTGNPAKLAAMREWLAPEKTAPLRVSMLGLEDFPGVSWPGVDESGNDPLENARIKALAYFRALREQTGQTVPVFSCDSGLYFDGVPDELQPGVHIRRVGGKPLNDEEMIVYYAALARRFGGRLTARYRNAICLVLDEDRLLEHMDDDIASDTFCLAGTPHPKREPGFPLNSLSVYLPTGEYYYNLPEARRPRSQGAPGFRTFFRRAWTAWEETQNWRNRQSAPEEIWDVYDAKRRPSGRTHRRGDPLPPGEYHLVVHVWVRNSRGELLTTQRAPTKGYPLFWECTAGSAAAGEDSLAAAVREVKEETGLLLRPENGANVLTLCRGDNFADIWLFRQDFRLEDVRFQPGETVDAKTAAPAEIRRMAAEGLFVEYSYLEELLQNAEKAEAALEKF
ncbi:MAG: NUDIX domain-containing protein [Oscillospiraceae bacterium]|jgi:8-oxo-dGTP pyrophosphatase MutT (NUDIX family)/inosine/xanthosine triphosphate pyrophosphatase family protein|nr:NUDIX domain-containing protein [Oscillospiraceae bacterium]